MKRSDERFAVSMVAMKQVAVDHAVVGAAGLCRAAAHRPVKPVCLRLTSQSVRDLVQANNLSAATMTAELVSRDLEHSINLARAFAAMPGMVEAVELRAARRGAG